MAADVETSIEIECQRSVVAAYVSDPDNATEWYVNIKSVDWETPRSVVVGSRVAVTRRFLQRGVFGEDCRRRETASRQLRCLTGLQPDLLVCNVSCMGA